ncbi:MAG: hypothetical protein OIF48_05265 [Silicimonas sp.]|nr:hypothetical protein [Silicimonas sp.]
MKKGSASLRQTLTVIRRALGTPRVFVCDDGYVTLNTAVLECHPGREAQARVKSGFDLPDFAEGVDVASPVFEDWIRDERARYHMVFETLGDEAPEGKDRRAGPIIFHLERGSTAEEADYSDLFTDLYFQGLSDLTRVRVEEGSAGEEADFKLRAEAIGRGTLQRLRGVLFCNGASQNRWAASEVLGDADPQWDPALLRLAYRCHETSLQMLSESSNQSTETVARTRGISAFTRLLDLSTEAFEDTDRDLAMAHDADPRGIYLAYRAFLRTNLIVERKSPDPQGMAGQARDFALRALRDEPLNGAVNAAVSHVRLLLDNDVASAWQFATRATEINPANPLGWSSLANALVRDERPRDALQASRRALDIARLSRHSYWWEMSASLVSAVNQDPRAALEYAQAARAKSPDFKPPLRYLVALYFHFGKIEAAAEALDQLKQLEPDFEFRLFDEASYPTATLRQLSLRGVSKISSL